MDFSFLDTNKQSIYINERFLWFLCFHLQIFLVFNTIFSLFNTSWRCHTNPGVPMGFLKKNSKFGPINRFKIFQPILSSRLASHIANIKKTSEELYFCISYFQVCSALREELDEQHKKRLESFEIKMKPIIIRDGPSQKVEFYLLKLYFK